MEQDRTELGLLIEQGIKEAIAYERGELNTVKTSRHRVTARSTTVAEPPHYGGGQVRQIRERLRFSQAVFARALNVSDSTVRAWEQGKREPEGPSRRLLEFASKYPDYFARTIRTGEGRERRGRSSRSRTRREKTSSER